MIAWFDQFTAAANPAAGKSKKDYPEKIDISTFMGVHPELRSAEPVEVMNSELMAAGVYEPHKTTSLKYWRGHLASSAGKHAPLAGWEYMAQRDIHLCAHWCSVETDINQASLSIHFDSNAVSYFFCARDVHNEFRMMVDSLCLVDAKQSPTALSWYTCVAATPKGKLGRLDLRFFANPLLRPASSVSASQLWREAGYGV